MTANIKSLVFYVIMTPFPFYKNTLNFQADLVLIKMGLYWPNFSLVFLIHLFLYAGVYCTYATSNSILYYIYTYIYIFMKNTLAFISSVLHSELFLFKSKLFKLFFINDIDSLSLFKTNEKENLKLNIIQIKKINVTFNTSIELHSH